MDKLSTAKVAQVLADAQQVILSVTDERDKLASKLSELETRREAEKVAAALHEKGMRLDTEYGVLVQELEKAASDGRLPVIQEAVDMVAPNMGIRATSLTNDEVTAGGGSALESYLVGNVG